MDRLVIRTMQLYAAIGVSDAEREVGQRLLLTVEVGYDLRAAGRSDALADTLSYAEIAEELARVAQQQRFRLLEALAEAMADALFARFPVAWVELELLKAPPPLPLPIEAAGVRIRREARTP